MKKRTKERKGYSGEFKIHVIIDMRENHLAYRETVRKHWNTLVHDLVHAKGQKQRRERGREVEHSHRRHSASVRL